MKYRMTEEKWEAVTRFFDRVFDSPDSAPDKALLLPLEDEEVTKIFTKKRIELIKTIKKRRPESVGELSGLVKRDLTAVQRDLKLLEGFHIVKLEKKGRVVRPIVEMEVMILPVVPIKPLTVEQVEKKPVRINRFVL